MTVDDRIREAYDRGFFVGTARAKNRVERGEPIGYDEKPTETDYAIDKARWMPLPGGGQTTVIDASLAAITNEPAHTRSQKRLNSIVED